MDREAVIILTLLGSAVTACGLLFGAIVVRRDDPSPHAVMLGSFGLGLAATLAISVVEGPPGGGWRTDRVLGVASLLATLFLVPNVVAWAFAAAIRPGDDVRSTFRGWLHAALVVTCIVGTGVLAPKGPYLLLFTPNLVHPVLAYRDSPRLRRAWGAIASIALFSTLAWWIGATLHDGIRGELWWIGPVSMLHHGFALLQSRAFFGSVALWPLSNLVAYEFFWATRY